MSCINAQKKTQMSRLITEKLKQKGMYNRTTPYKTKTTNTTNEIYFSKNKLSLIKRNSTRRAYIIREFIRTICQN